MYPINPFNGVGARHRWLGLMPILVKTSQNKMSVELLLSTRILLVMKLVTCMVTCVIVVFPRRCFCQVLKLPAVNTSLYRAWQA